MDVNFEKINTLADKRRQALEALATLVDQAPAQAALLAGVADYATQLQAAWTAVDAEGRALLPEGLQVALSRFHAGNYRTLLKDSTSGETYVGGRKPLGLLTVACYATPKPAPPEPEPEPGRYNW